MKAINTYAIPVLTFSFERVKWSPTDLENLQTKTRTLLTRYRFRHLRAAKERLTLPRQMGGRGMNDISLLHDKQVKLLQTYFLNKQASLSLHVAVVKVDDAHHWIYSAQMKTNSPQMKKVPKSLTRPIPARSQPTTCRHRSVEQHVSN